MGRDTLIEGIKGLKVGERFTVTNKDPPDWARGVFEIIEIRPNSISCQRVKEKK